MMMAQNFQENILHIFFFVNNGLFSGKVLGNIPSLHTSLLWPWKPSLGCSRLIFRILTDSSFILAVINFRLHISALQMICWFFSAVDTESILLIKETLSEFEKLSGLSANLNKSEIFCANLSHGLKIKSFLAFNLGREDFLLDTLDCVSFLANSAYKIVIPHWEISARINAWSPKKLSFTGKLQPLQAVLYSIQRYWSSLFILHMKVIKVLQQNGESTVQVT